MKITVNRNQISLIAEEVVADGNAEHNPYAKKWKAAKDALKSYLFKEGSIMTSKEFVVMYDLKLSNLLDNKRQETTQVFSLWDGLAFNKYFVKNIIFVYFCINTKFYEV